MSELIVNGGPLAPKVHDGSEVDAVYGVDASGNYLGVVPAAQASAAADRPPPTLGLWCWSGGAWIERVSAETQALLIEQERDRRLALGVQWSGRNWYSDQTFQQQVAAYLQSYAEGIIPAGMTVEVRGRDKVVYALTRDELRELAGVVLAYVAEVWQWSWDQKALIQG